MAHCSRGVFLSVAISGLVLAFPSSAAGQDIDPLVTDRPDFTESAEAVAPGRVQLEVGYTLSRIGEESSHTFGEVLARVGILPGLEGRVGLNSFALTSATGIESSGLEDVSLGFKIVIFEPDAATSTLSPRAAILAGAELPTGSDAFGAGEVQPGATVAFAWDLSSSLGLGVNAGLASLTSGDERFGQGSASVALGRGIGESLSMYAEWYGLFPEVSDGGSSHYLNGGFAWLLSADLQLDWRVGLGLQDPEPNWFTGAGLSVRI